MILDDYHQIATILNAGPQDVNYISSQFIEIICTSEVAKIRKVFTKRIYLFDFVSMERLKLKSKYIKRFHSNQNGHTHRLAILRMRNILASTVKIFIEKTIGKSDFLS